MDKEFKKIVVQLLLLIANKVALGSRGTTEKESAIISRAGDFVREIK